MCVGGRVGGPRHDCPSAHPRARPATTRSRPARLGERRPPVTVKQVGQLRTPNHPTGHRTPRHPRALFLPAHPALTMSTATPPVRVPLSFCLSRPPPPHMPPRCPSALSPARRSTCTSSARRPRARPMRSSRSSRATRSRGWPSARAPSLAGASPRRCACTSCRLRRARARWSAAGPPPTSLQATRFSLVTPSSVRASSRARGCSRASRGPRRRPVRFAWMWVWWGCGGGLGGVCRRGGCVVWGVRTLMSACAS